MNEEMNNQEKQDINIGVKVNKSGKLIVALIISILIIAALIYFIFGGFRLKRETVASTSTLEKVVKARELSSYKFIYNGIAPKKYKGKKKVKYNVYYESTVKAGVDLSKVNITKRKKKVIVQLPKITYTSYNVDYKTLAIMNMGIASLDESTIIQEAYHVALADLKKEVKTKRKKEIDKVAKRNARKIVKGLLEPLVKPHDWKVIVKVGG